MHKSSESFIWMSGGCPAAYSSPCREMSVVELLDMLAGVVLVSCDLKLNREM